MTKEKLFEFAVEKGWDKILEVAYTIHFFPEIAKKLGKKQTHLEIDLRFMQSMGLVQFSRKSAGGFCYAPTLLGIELMQKQSEKAGRTYSCQLCGTTTGLPHICPEFYPEMR